MSLLDCVNICQGTASVSRFSHGNTLPLTQRPFGMAAFAPQTERKGEWFYHPNDRCLEGVRLTHQPSPWVGDFGTLILLPQAGTKAFEPWFRWSGYRPEDAVLQPHYMKLDFLRCGCTFELTPTERGAVIRYAFPATADDPCLSLLRLEGGITFTPDEANRRLYGTTDYIRIRTEEPPFCMYFVLEFEHGFSWEKSTQSNDGAHVALNSPHGTVRLATSYISAEQALANLQSECGTFDEVKAQGEAVWEEMLGRIAITADDEALRRTFYSCLYRTLLFPNKTYERQDGQPIHFDPHTGDVKAGYMYTNNGFWDTYRTVYPLLSLIAPDILPEILQGFLQNYRDCGWLPRWPSMREFGIMPGTLIDAVLADGAVKGMLSPDDLATALAGMRRHAEEQGTDPFGRQAVAFYREHGYVPRSVKESVNQTLDYAYGDFCIAQIADLLGETAVAQEYRRRAQNYRNLYDPATDFMRSRDEDGHMTDPAAFDPLAWGGDYAEGGAWQSSFAIPHDLDGMVELYGGRDAFLKKLDTLFNQPPLYHVGAYGFEIHEMTEMAACDYGQCAISNQPSFHYPWLYAALGETEKATYWVQRMAREVFSFRNDGFPGDEDNGTMAAWYIFAVLGFYPLCPGRAEYIRTAPMVQAAAIRGKAVPYQNISPVFSQADLA